MDKTVQEVTEKYVKEEEKTTQENEIEDVVYNLNDSEDFEKLEEEVNSNGIFFKPKENIAYKIKLTSTLVKEIETVFNGEKKTRYEISINALGFDGSDFEGVWQIGSMVLNQIMKQYKDGGEYTLVKTGSGLETKYAITPII